MPFVSISSFFTATFLLLFLGSVAGQEYEKEIGLLQDIVDVMEVEPSFEDNNEEQDTQPDLSRAIRNFFPDENVMEDLLCNFVYKIRDAIETLLIRGILKGGLMTYDCYVMSRCGERSNGVVRLRYVERIFQKSYNKWARTVCPLHYYNQ